MWIETPTNPTMKVVDIKTCSDLVHEHNKDIVVVVDNTFMSAYFQVRPTDDHFMCYWYWSAHLIIPCNQILACVEWLTHVFILYYLSAPWL